MLMYPFNPNWTTHYPFSRRDSCVSSRSGFAEKGVAVDRLHVLEAQPSRGPILGILKLADLYLDSFPYSGAVSLIDPLTMGCPPVVREGHTAAAAARSAALLREIGLEVLVTKSTDDYVTVVTRLLLDPTLRREMSEAVLEVSAHFKFGTGGATIGLGNDVGDVLLAALRKKLKSAVI